MSRPGVQIAYDVTGRLLDRLGADRIVRITMDSTGVLLLDLTARPGHLADDRDRVTGLVEVARLLDTGIRLTVLPRIPHWDVEIGGIRDGVAVLARTTLAAEPDLILAPLRALTPAVSA